jgi:tartrate-resistant acid phosphatase type 5
MNHQANRREFLRQSFAFSALAGKLGSLPVLAAEPSADARHLLMVGDWGWEGDLTGQTATARQMARYTLEHALKPEAMLMLGDSWYGAMPGGVDDVRWKTQFEQMYPEAVFACPAYSVMGNHDYQRIPATVTKTEMELAYAKRAGTRWTQPSLWYTFDFPQKAPLIRFIALDSNVYDERLQHDGNFTLSRQQQAEQLRWLEAELARPRQTPFTVVMGHHPIFSNGPHGDHKVLIEEWEPLLRRHNVSLYLAGHDHDLQHLEFEGHPTSFVCSGAGGADLYDLKIAEEQRGPFAEKVYGFSHLEATPDKLTVRHITADGKLVHTFSKTSNGIVRVGA